MKIGLRVGVSDFRLTVEKHNLPHTASEEITRSLTGKEFGADVTALDVALIMTLVRPGYEEWYKERKPKYTAYKKSRSRLTGEVIEITKTIAYDIKLSEDLIGRFANEDVEGSKNLLLEMLISSLEKVEPVTKNLDFDWQKLRAALRELSLIKDGRQSFLNHGHAF